MQRSWGSSACDLFREGQRSPQRTEQTAGGGKRRTAGEVPEGSADCCTAPPQTEPSGVLPAGNPPGTPHPGMVLTAALPPCGLPDETRWLRCLPHVHTLQHVPIGACTWVWTGRWPRGAHGAQHRVSAQGLLRGTVTPRAVGCRGARGKGRRRRGARPASARSLGWTPASATRWSVTPRLGCGRWNTNAGVGAYEQQSCIPHGPGMNVRDPDAGGLGIRGGPASWVRDGCVPCVCSPGRSPGAPGVSQDRCPADGAAPSWANPTPPPRQHLLIPPPWGSGFRPESRGHIRSGTGHRAAAVGGDASPGAVPDGDGSRGSPLQGCAQDLGRSRGGEVTTFCRTPVTACVSGPLATGGPPGRQRGTSGSPLCAWSVGSLHPFPASGFTCPSPAPWDAGGQGQAVTLQSWGTRLIPGQKQGRTPCGPSDRPGGSLQGTLTPCAAGTCAGLRPGPVRQQDCPRQPCAQRIPPNLLAHMHVISCFPKNASREETF